MLHQRLLTNLSFQRRTIRSGSGHLKKKRSLKMTKRDSKKMAIINVDLMDVIKGIFVNAEGLLSPIALDHLKIFFITIIHAVILLFRLNSSALSYLKPQHFHFILAFCKGNFIIPFLLKNAY